MKTEKEIKEYFNSKLAELNELKIKLGSSWFGNDRVEILGAELLILRQILNYWGTDFINV